jgi:hypothetical protein
MDQILMLGKILQLREVTGAFSIDTPTIPTPRATIKSDPWPDVWRSKNRWNCWKVFAALRAMAVECPALGDLRKDSKSHILKMPCYVCEATFEVKR